MNAIGTAFGSSSAVFWEEAQRLHELEIVDMYEDEVVRISDQVLATYLFYLAFFKQQTLDFSVLLECFFPSFIERLRDVINPVLNAFNSKTVMDTMRRYVDRIWTSLKNDENEEGLLHLMDFFWYLKETDALMYLQTEIDKINAEPLELSILEFKTDSNIPSPSLLSILRSFKHADESKFRTALDLLFRYVTKKSRDLPKVLYLLTEHFGFTHNSYLWGFKAQRLVLDALWNYTQIGKDALFSKLFFAVAEPYLHTYFQNVEAKDGHSLSIIKFDLPPIPELFELRRQIWNRLFQLYQSPPLKDAVLEVVHQYSTAGYHVRGSKIVEDDATQILPFIESTLDAGNYRHCILVQDYLDFLDGHNATFDKALRDRFKNEAYVISELLLDDPFERKNLELNYLEFQKYKQGRIREHFAFHTFSAYQRFFEQCLEIASQLNSDHQKFQLRGGIVEVLLALMDRDPKLYMEVFEHYLGLGDLFELGTSGSLVQRLINGLGADQVEAILNGSNLPTKRNWLFSYHVYLPSNEVTRKRLNQLYTLYREANQHETPKDFDFLPKYGAIDEAVVCQVTRIILEKAEKDSHYAPLLSWLFYSHSEVNKAITVFFATDIVLLKRAYLLTVHTDRHEDNDGGTFSRILDVDRDFILEYLDEIYKEKRRVRRGDDTRDYSFLWMRMDFKDLMARVVERIYQHEKERGSFWHTYLETFFRLREPGKHNAEIRQKQDLFLRDLIEQRYDDSDFMKYLFSLIAKLPPEMRRSLVATFLQRNTRFEDFRALSLEPSTWSWSGSAVPTLQKRVDYFESLLPLLNAVELLQHRQYVEHRIQGLFAEIEREKKSEFMGD
jgi:hypothetical protein